MAELTDEIDALRERHAELSWVSVHDASDQELRWMEWADRALAEIDRLAALSGGREVPDGR